VIATSAFGKVDRLITTDLRWPTEKKLQIVVTIDTI